MPSIGEKLTQWEVAQGLGKKPGTRRVHAEVLKVIRKHWPDCDQPAESVTDQDVIDFGARVAHYCPSRWNLIVSIMRSVTPRAACLRYRKLRFRQFIPPAPAQFLALLEAADKLPRSHVGLAIRFLTLTGLRICEARALRWEEVTESSIHVPAGISKNGVGRTVPFLPGLAVVLKRLRSASNGSGLVLPDRHFRRGLAKACDRAGIPRLSYHCFRHLFATRCIEAGVDVPTVARWIGHQDGGALLSEMYFHLLDEHSRQMAARVKIAV